MRWRPGSVSSDVEDRRGEGSGFGGGSRGPGIRLGLGGIAVVLVLSVLTGRNFLALLEPDAGPGDYADGQPYQPAPGEEELVQFVSFVLDDAQATWTRELPSLGFEYRRAKLVLFTDSIRSGCGYGEAARGPFYCPLDEKVYIDLGFYRELKRRFGAPGDFAQAYVIAHEIGHHVQNILGFSGRIRAMQERDPGRANGLSVRLELQADCLAGVWGYSTQQRDVLESGDVEEALTAAAAIGDDRIQKTATGRVNPETWTHGSSRQRVAWFRHGLLSGRADDCDTFTQDVPED